MKKLVDLTLGIPTYNSRDYLLELFKSIKMQSVLPKKIVFIDDASIDDSVKMIRTYFDRYEINAELLVNPVNLGIAATYNKFLDLATTKWIQILDSDDYFIGDYYYNIQNLLDKNYSAILTGMRSNSISISLFNVLLASFIPKNLPSWIPMLGSFGTRSGVIYRTEIVKEIGFMTPAFDGSDIIHLFEVRKRGICIYEPKSLIYYRIHSKSTSTKDGNNNIYSKILESNKEIPFSYKIDYFIRKKMFGFLRNYYNEY